MRRWWRMPMRSTSRRPVTLMTLHNAKGLEFPVVFLAGMELGLFPHSRSMNSEAALEEERRLCYVGMTRARKRLILTWAKYRRRFGGGEQERSTPSWFLSEVPEQLIVNLGQRDEPGEVNLHGERHDVRQAAKRNTFTGQDLQFGGEHFAVLRRARHAVQSPTQPPPQPHHARRRSRRLRALRRAASRCPGAAARAPGRRARA